VVAGAVVLTAQSQQSTGLDLARLARIDEVVADAIGQHQLPGAVVVVGRGDAVAFRKAYGRRAVDPVPEPMTLETIFDLASLTKVVATTPAVMMLVEEGRIRLIDPVAAFIPEFAKYGKDRVTIRDLMTHMSGLRPDLDLSGPWTGAAEAVRLATEEVLTDPPGRRFIYSDINYLLLGEIVSRVSKRPSPNSAGSAVSADRHARDDVQPAGGAGAAHRADPTVHAIWLALRGPWHDDAARSGARPHGTPHGRRGRACGRVQHRGGFDQIRAHAPRRRRD
jgi:hypothetical protein